MSVATGTLFKLSPRSGLPQYESGWKGVLLGDQLPPPEEARDFPCWECDCSNAPVWRQLLRSLKDPAAINAGTKLLVDRGFELALGILRERPDAFRLPIALGALFDLVVNLHYIRATLADTDWVYCPGDGEDKASFYFIFVGTCPRHSVAGQIPALTEARHKPPSGRIGTITGDVYVYMLARIIESLGPEYRVFKTTQRDVDVLIYGQDLICLEEVKASPLVAYPLEIEAEAPLVVGEEEGAEPRIAKEHAITDVQLQFIDRVQLYLPQVPFRLPLGQLRAPIGPDDATLWQRVADALNEDNFLAIVAGWQRLYDAYVRTPVLEESEEAIEVRPAVPDPAIWLTFGCGKPRGWPARVPSIDDTKNRPGIDRTDDLKKGTYQVLKMGADFKDNCTKGIIRTALGGNFHAASHHAVYLEKLDLVKWTKEPNVTYEGDQARVPANLLFNLYDALLCFTQSFFRRDQPVLSRIASVERLERRMQGAE